MADEPKVEPAAGEEAGDEVEKTSPEPTETPGGDHAGADDAEADAQAARDEWIAGLVAKGVEQALSRFQPASQAPAAQPPTAGRGIVAELEAERDTIAAEMRRVEENIRKDGLTAQNIYDRQTAFDRKADWLAKVQLEAARQSDAERQLDKAGNEEEWRQYAAQYPPGTDLMLLRKAFLHDKREAEAAAAANKPKPRFTPPPAGSDRRVVDVSGASEVSAAERKARTMTGAQIEARKDELRIAGKREELISFERDIRNGQVIRK